MVNLSCFLLCCSFQKLRRGDAAILLKGFAEVVNISEIQSLSDLADGEKFIGKQQLLGFFDAVVLPKIHGGFHRCIL